MYKKFILKILFLALSTLLIITAINIKVDTGFLVKDINSQVAAIMVQGKNAGIKYMPSTPTRDLLKEVVTEEVKHHSPAKDILVFGTSRSGDISGKFFPHNTFFNCAVSGGNILHYIALY